MKRSELWKLAAKIIVDNMIEKRIFIEASKLRLFYPDKKMIFISQIKIQKNRYCVKFFTFNTSKF